MSAPERRTAKPGPNIKELFLGTEYAEVLPLSFDNLLHPAPEQYALLFEQWEHLPQALDRQEPVDQFVRKSRPISEEWTKVENLSRM